MNENCPPEASNLTNPSQHFQEVSGLKFNTPRGNVHEYLYFDELSDDIKVKQIAASTWMHSLGKQLIDDFTFIIPYNTHHTSHRTFNPTPPHAPTMTTTRDDAHHTSH
jgi:hypothetical protein